MPILSLVGSTSRCIHANYGESGIHLIETGMISGAACSRPAGSHTTHRPGPSHWSLVPRPVFEGSLVRPGVVSRSKKRRADGC